MKLIYPYVRNNKPRKKKKRRRKKNEKKRENQSWRKKRRRNKRACMGLNGPACAPTTRTHELAFPRPSRTPKSRSLPYRPSHPSPPRIPALTAARPAPITPLTIAGCLPFQPCRPPIPLTVTIAPPPIWSRLGRRRPQAASARPGVVLVASVATNLRLVPCLAGLLREPTTAPAAALASAVSSVARSLSSYVPPASPAPVRCECRGLSPHSAAYRVGREEGGVVVLQLSAPGTSANDLVGVRWWWSDKFSRPMHSLGAQADTEEEALCRWPSVVPALSSHLWLRRTSTQGR